MDICNWALPWPWTPQTARKSPACGDFGNRALEHLSCGLLLQLLEAAVRQRLVQVLKCTLCYDCTTVLRAHCRAHTITIPHPCRRENAQSSPRPAPPSSPPSVRRAKAKKRNARGLPRRQQRRSLHGSKASRPVPFLLFPPFSSPRPPERAPLCIQT